MSRVCVTHTACGQPVDLTDDNRIVTPNTDHDHTCTGPAGPWTVTPHGRRWTLQFALDSEKAQPIYPTQHDAQQEANSRNHTYERAHAPTPPQPSQAALFDHQEATG